ncbi:hypothetical protein Bca52824_021939 [Brassica carinata]|uniref:FKB95-like N-terminal Kelch domain-containing protein n=1 Tax=Brassica carinata TaxID=52824 RepID=A0A8X7VFG6_BRACI|nr:hypothetical protein Bca52824_021939 [Brassica carinata]
MVASPELYKARSLLGLTESCLYVCLRFGFGFGFGLGSYKWHTLVSSKSSGGYVLARVPVPDDDSPCVVGSGDLVAVGSDIYNIGTHLPHTSGVSILDCKSHTWRKAPSMPVELESLSASVLDREIYVLGRRYHRDGYWKNSFEVFNTNTQTWDIPCHGLDCPGVTYIIDGKLHAVTLFDMVFAFNSKQGRWDLVEQHRMLTDSTCSESCCEIDNVLYSVSNDRALRWYDTDKTMWRDLKGLVGLPKFPTHGHGSFVKLTGYGGGKMMVFWNRNLMRKYACSTLMFGFQPPLAFHLFAEEQGVNEPRSIKWARFTIFLSEFVTICQQKIILPNKVPKERGFMMVLLTGYMHWKTVSKQWRC